MDRLFLDKAVFDSLCEGRGWDHTTERCQHLNIGRTTLHRWYRGEAAGRRAAYQVCNILDVRLGAVFTNSYLVAAGGTR